MVVVVFVCMFSESVWCFFFNFLLLGVIIVVVVVN